MKGRRYFLKQGALATTAILAAKPFNAIAGAASPFGWLTGRHTKLVFLHTRGIDHNTMQYIANSKRSNEHAIVLNAGRDFNNGQGNFNFDAPVNPAHSFSSISSDYTIISKGGIKTGIITLKPGETEAIKKVNALSVYLKKKKNCDIVVCLSQMGYKNKNAPDDMTLAASSTCLDIIIGGHSTNFSSLPVIALNRVNAEVIIHSAADKTVAAGKIEIGFDKKGRKTNLSFNS